MKEQQVASWCYRCCLRLNAWVGVAELVMPEVLSLSLQPSLVSAPASSPKQTPEDDYASSSQLQSARMRAGCEYSEGSEASPAGLRRRPWCIEGGNKRWQEGTRGRWRGVGLLVGRRTAGSEVWRVAWVSWWLVVAEESVTSFRLLSFRSPSTVGPDDEAADAAAVSQSRGPVLWRICLTLETWQAMMTERCPAWTGVYLDRCCCRRCLA